MTSDARRQHYVPRFYLRGFAGPDGLIQILDRKNRRFPAARGPKALCVEDYFYGVEARVRDDVSQAIEGAFQEMENRLGNEVPKICSAIELDREMTPQGRYALAMLMSMLWIRGSAMREQVSRMQTDVLKTSMAMLADHDRFEARIREQGTLRGETPDDEAVNALRNRLAAGDYDPKWNNSLHLSMLDEIPNWANLFNVQDWLILINESGLPFVTSDNPVGVFEPEREGFPVTFVERTHCLALSPQLCLIASCPDRMGPEGQLFRRIVGPSEVQGIRWENLRLGHQARFVYANSREPLTHILEYLLASPRPKPQQTRNFSVRYTGGERPPHDGAPAPRGRGGGQSRKVRAASE